MNVLDFYLLNHNTKREDVQKQTGISQQLLTTHKSKKINKYSVIVLNAIADTLGKNVGDVLNDLLIIEKENPAFEVRNPNKLYDALEAKFEQIIIKGDYYKEVRKIMDTHLSENERLGVELGSAGVLTLLIYAIDAVRDLFSKVDKMDKEIDKKLNLYKIKKVSNDGLLLSLKQLDY